VAPGLGLRGPQITVTVREPVASDWNDSGLRMWLRCLASSRPHTKQSRIVSHYYGVEKYHISRLYLILKYKMLHERPLEEDCYF